MPDARSSLGTSAHQDAAAKLGLPAGGLEGRGHYIAMTG